MLELNNVNVYYGDVQALWDVSMSIEKGDIVALIGANASGKSTTINAISGVVKPSSGSIKFKGNETTKLSPPEIVELGISQVPEGRRLFPIMTVLDNLELGAYTGRARKNTKNRLEHVFDLFPVLEQKKSQLAGSLSGGEQQMCAIGRALMSEPELLLLDELSLGLAPIIVIKLFEIVKNIASQGTTILLVEQNVKHSLSISDYAFVLENGRMTLQGKANELISNPELKRAYLGL